MWQLVQGSWQGLWIRLEVLDTTKYSGNKDRGRRGLYTHEEGWHRWKTSGIRGDIRLVTQEEGPVTWNERRVTFQNKTWNSQDKKKQDKTSLTTVWQAGHYQKKLCRNTSSEIMVLLNHVSGIQKVEDVNTSPKGSQWNKRTGFEQRWW